MAIVIDGTGSITGLSAGGLPDGSITAADLASTLDLTGKTVTLPAGTGGKVLQVQQTQTNNQIQSTNTIPYDNSTPLFSEGVEVMALNFTPVSASSTLYIFITVYGNENSNSGDNIVFPVFRESTFIGMGYLGATGGEAGNGANWDSCTFTVKHQPGSTTAQTYYVRAGCNAGTYEHLADTTYVGNAKYGANTRSTMVIFEVAG